MQKDMKLRFTPDNSQKKSSINKNMSSEYKKSKHSHKNVIQINNNNQYKFEIACHNPNCMVPLRAN